MPLLYHAYVYLEFLILACTIYILAPMDREEYNLAKNALENLTELLGEEHPKVIALKSEYEIEAEE